MGVLPPRKAKDAVPCPIEASRTLLERMEASFAMFARKWGVEYIDARTLLMNASGL